MSKRTQAAEPTSILPGRRLEKAPKGFVYGSKVRQEVFDRQNGRCGICHLPMDRNNFDTDHIVPLLKYRGDKKDPNNAQAVHRHCHADKTKAEMKAFNLERSAIGANKGRSYGCAILRTLPGCESRQILHSTKDFRDTVLVQSHRALEINIQFADIAAAAVTSLPTDDDVQEKTIAVLKRIVAEPKSVIDADLKTIQSAWQQSEDDAEWPIFLGLIQIGRRWRKIRGLTSVNFTTGQPAKLTVRQTKQERTRDLRLADIKRQRLRTADDIDAKVDDSKRPIDDANGRYNWPKFRQTADAQKHRAVEIVRRYIKLIGNVADFLPTNDAVKQTVSATLDRIYSMPQTINDGDIDIVLLASKLSDNTTYRHDKLRILHHLTCIRRLWIDICNFADNSSQKPSNGEMTVRQRAQTARDIRLPKIGLPRIWIMDPRLPKRPRIQTNDSKPVTGLRFCTSDPAESDPAESEDPEDATDEHSVVATDEHSVVATDDRKTAGQPRRQIFMLNKFPIPRVYQPHAGLVNPQHASTDQADAKQQK